jgi:hypothetical protein
MLVQFREKPFAGKFVTIDPHGYRVGAEQSPWPIDEAYTNIFFFGGSTAVGYGVKDADTIASRVHARLAEAGLERPPRVYNFGRGAFYSTQERLLFDKMITFGETPDMAIFLDGLNDFFYFEDPPILTEMWTARVKREAAHPILASLERLPLLRVLRSFGVAHVFERHDSRARKSQGRGTQPDGRKKKLKDTGLDDSAKAGGSSIAISQTSGSWMPSRPPAASPPCSSGSLCPRTSTTCNTISSMATSRGTNSPG